MNKDELRTEIERLGPWHHKLHITDDIYTTTGAESDHMGQKVSLVDPMMNMKQLMTDALPNGMEGRSFLDCACNAGGYSFAAKDWGASKTMGFDVRQHWIDQAEFVRTHRDAPSDNMTFKQADLLDLSFLEPRYDVTWFSGIFYHLPDPVTVLKNVADRTEELMLLNTAVTPCAPDVEEVPTLNLKLEGTEQLMSGIYRLAWAPSGPKVLQQILAWAGFPETRLMFWYKTVERPGVNSNGRLTLLAARTPGRLDDVPNATPLDVKHMRHRIS